MNNPNQPWKPATCVAFRFSFIYFVFYLLPFPILTLFGAIPLLARVGTWYNSLFTAIARWVGPNVLGIEVIVQPTGSGDTALSLVLLFIGVVISVVGTAIWTLLDRRRTNYNRLYDLLRVYVRSGLGTIMLGYGAFKIIPTQFPYPSLVRLLEPLGNSSPMGLLWKFMGYSVAFNVFAGLSEFVGGFLLFFRRTTTLGSLLLIAVLGNVAMMNYSFDVPVKLYSSTLLLMAMFLTRPDLKRLVNVLFANRTAEARNLGSLLPTGRARIAGWVVKALFVGWAMWSTLNTSWSFYASRAQRPAFYGIHDVESFVRNGDTAPPLLTDSTRWRRLIVDGTATGAFVTIQTMTSPLQGADAIRYTFASDSSNGIFTLTNFSDTTDIRQFNYESVSPGIIRAMGLWDTDTLQLDLKRFDETTFLLTRTRFKWINELPFNR